MLFRESIHLENTLTCEQQNRTKNIYLLQNTKGAVTKVGCTFCFLIEFAYYNEWSDNIAAEHKNIGENVTQHKNLVQILPVLFSVIQFYLSHSKDMLHINYLDKHIIMLSKAVVRKIKTLSYSFFQDMFIVAQISEYEALHHLLAEMMDTLKMSFTRLFCITDMRNKTWTHRKRNSALALPKLNTGLALLVSLNC